ncbi:MAG: hypothetical protein P4L38_12620 [Syntrophaceae bacterium]|nr:hypothetical protein [Syntrophaceae bacterium]
MRTWLQKLERMAAAAAFAEEGEWQMARDILQESERRSVAREAEKKNRRKIRLREPSYRA